MMSTEGFKARAMDVLGFGVAIPLEDQAVVWRLTRTEKLRSSAYPAGSYKCWFKQGMET